jgi:glycosyltransferase involved in cell wall biosynthesis
LRPPSNLSVSTRTEACRVRRESLSSMAGMERSPSVHACPRVYSLAMPNLASVSFIIPAHNEQQLLGRTLGAIAAVARSLNEPVEVIVVDDASTDGTAAIARAQQARVVSVQCRHISAARNAGARVANGEMLLFVDADTVVNTAAVRSAIAAMRAGAVGGGSAFRFDGRVPLYARVLTAMALLVFRAAHLAGGCFLFCTRSAFDAVGGFDETVYAAEEAVMSRALARQGRFVILRESVVTSGRKLRTHRAGEILGFLLRLALKRRNAVHRRDRLDLWYGERREDRHVAWPENE